ncbi:hypothetical protein BDN67DRAFT_983725 [Paxillus ammoniavirescens]|nr:hypothetical protein BDN67DRAFT_983725 [Paxillus ammoniavirescens]
MLEGEVAASVQLVDEISKAQDGTSHKNINHAVHHITYSGQGEESKCSITRFVGIQHEFNHTSETQLEGWQGLIMDMYTTYNKCMDTQVDLWEHVEKVKGMLTDHAEDQRKRVRLFWGWRQLAWRKIEQVIEDAGGFEACVTLPASEQQKRVETTCRAMHYEIGVEKINSLSQAEKDTTNFFIWGGCCMHKEPNAVKGVSGCGAVKALDLTGSVFCHKDDKKGQQDSLHYHLKAQLGYFFPWPDTSNTQYQSHCDGASAWLICCPLYISYLEIVMDQKDSCTHTNIERNVHQTFRRPKTAEEMACLSRLTSKSAGTKHSTHWYPAQRTRPPKKKDNYSPFNKQWKGTLTGLRHQMVLKRRLAMMVVQVQGSQI